MIIKMFAVLDTKTGAFSNPWAHISEDSGIREFSDSVNDGSNAANMWYRHPEDYSLFLVGDFVTDTGELIPCLPKSLVTASALRSVSRANDKRAVMGESPLFGNSMKESLPS